jgi:thiol-disulfide isomerase/thioredoxin
MFSTGQKMVDKHDSASALDWFRKADKQDGNHCIACETEAYKLAGLVGDYKSQREEAALLLANGSGDAAKADAHYLAGKACLSEGGYRIYEQPFQDADKEFQAALQLQPEMSVCLYEDGVALAHLHQYGKAQERFQQHMKAAQPGELEYKRAKLFAVQPELARKRVAPAFHVTALDGKPIAMESLAGKVVLLDFWATWCGPCKLALPHLKEIAEKFQGQPLVVISISLDADEPTWKNFVAHNGMTWLQYRDGGFDGPMATTFAVKAIPTTFTIDADGFVQDQQVGDGEIESKLKKLINQISSQAQGPSSGPASIRTAAEPSAER